MDQFIWFLFAVIVVAVIVGGATIARGMEDDE